MKKIAIAVLGILALGAIGLVAGVSTQEDHTHMERSIVVEATPADMTYFSHDLQGVNEWSPWEGRDPNQSSEYSDPSGGVGATYHWSGNDDVGEGTMTIASVKDGEVVIDLHFIRPFEGKAQATISYVAEGEDTKVTWAYDQDNEFGGKVMLMFMDLEAMLAPDYEKGLALLKPLVEQAAEQRVAEAESKAKAKAEAEAKAKAEAAAAAGAGTDAADPVGD
jgi:hypothetical protein